MKRSNLSFVPLNQASLCLDCEMITEATNTCAACGSSALMNMARTLGQPRHQRRFRGQNAVPVKVAYSSFAERRVFLGEQNRLSSQGFGFACLQGE